MRVAIQKTLGESARGLGIGEVLESVNASLAAMAVHSPEIGLFRLTWFNGFSAFTIPINDEDRGLATLRLAEVRKEISVEDAKRAPLGSPRPVAVVEEAMRGLEQDRKWKWSEGCKDASSEGLRSFCKSYQDLKVEAARSTELASVEAKIERLKGEARHYEEKGAGREADNQAAVIGRVVGLSPVEVDERLSFLLAIVVEVGAALGLYLATGHMRMGASPAAMPAVAFESVALKDVPVLQVMDAPKQIRGPGPRRVPRRKGKDSVASETNEKQEG